MSRPEPPPFLEVSGITRRYPGVTALDRVTLAVMPGEVHALLGENGAGKSTLIRILTGVEQADEGTIRINGHEVRFSNTHDALRLGISAIYQDPSLVPAMSIEDNVMLGREPGRGIWGFVDERQVRARTREALDRVGLNLDPRLPVGRLKLGQQQLIALAKALAVDARLIIMDEPTASLTNQEIEYLFTIIDELRSQGISVIYVSHRLEEIFRIADVVSVLRDGHYVGTRAVEETDSAELIRMIVGRNVELEAHRRAAPQAEVALAVRELTRRGAFEDVSFQIRRGEVVAFSGLVGSGRSEVARAIFGAEAIDSGSIEVLGKPVTLRSSRDALRHGIGMVPEDRKHQGIVPRASVQANITLASVRRYCTNGLIRSSDEQTSADAYVRRLDIKTPDLGKEVIHLSGGNQQKVVLAKVLDCDARVFLLDEPTAGVDVGAKAEIRALINQLAEQGHAILLISSEIPEVLALADRILVMRAGRLVGELDGATASPEAILTLAVGEAG